MNHMYHHFDDHLDDMINASYKMMTDLTREITSSDQYQTMGTCKAVGEPPIPEAPGNRLTCRMGPWGVSIGEMGNLGDGKIKK